MHVLLPPCSMGEGRCPQSVSPWPCRGASSALEPFLGGEASEEQLQQIRGQQEKAHGNTWGDVWTDMENRKHPRRGKEAGIR